MKPFFVAETSDFDAGMRLWFEEQYQKSEGRWKRFSAEFDRVGREPLNP